MDEETPQKYTVKEITNTGRTIEKMKKNKNKRDANQKSIFPIKGIYILTEIVKKQNKSILEKIGEDFLDSSEEQEKFIKKYSKPNFYVAVISKTEQEEKSQKTLLKMM